MTPQQKADAIRDRRAVAPPLKVHTMRQYEASQGEGHGRIRVLITVIDGEVIEVAERAVGAHGWSRPLPLVSL